MNINQRLQNLRTQWSAFQLIDKKARPGCLESGKVATWQCCDFHKQAEKEDLEMTDEAIALTLLLLPNSQQHSEVPSMVWVNDELMSALSIRWWELISEAIKKGLKEGVDND